MKLKFLTGFIATLLIYLPTSLTAGNIIVDTRIGSAPSITKTAGAFGKNTEELGQTIPAVLEPNGMNFWTAQTRDTEQKCIAPYYFRDTRLQGFRNSHWVNGGCTQDYGSMTLMPLYGTLRCQPEARATPFSHTSEQATPSYYSVSLPQESIFAEMTGRSRSAIFRFTYSKSGDAYLVINPNSDEGEGYIRIDPQRKCIYGYNPVHRIYQGWGEPAGYSGHFVIFYQKDPVDYGTFSGDSIFKNETHIKKRQKIGLYIHFKVKAGEQILIKAASSFTDKEGAEKNLQKEIPHWNFQQTQNELNNIWKKQFTAINIQTKDNTAKKKFYSALYRSSFLPRTFNDVDGRYPTFAAGKPIQHLPAGKTYYDDFSLWDTFRALHPLINLLYPTKAGEMMQSLVYKYRQGGWLPIFPCWNSYTAAMIGDHATAAISDAYIKGIRNFDINTAYEGMLQNAFQQPQSVQDYKNGKGRRALQSYLKYGYIPLEDSVPDAFHTKEQVSRTMEYAFDDFALSQVARLLGKNNDYNQLINRALNYKNVINPVTGYADGRYANGQFLTNTNPFTFTKFITEGAPCHYTWYAPQDPYGLMQCMGGKKKYIERLDSMFTQKRYWHGNEPCHQIAFMFNYGGQSWKTQQYVRHIMDTEYLDDPGGLSGNDDAGQMSAWYVFAALGFYPVCPGTPYYILASPSFAQASLHLENGKTFTIKAPKASAKNIYIQKVFLNGKDFTRNYISHNEIMQGGTIEFIMGDRPNKQWGVKKSDCPPSLIPLQDKK